MNIESYFFIALAKGASTDLAEFVGWSRQNMATYKTYKTYKIPRFEIVAELPLSVSGSDNRVDLAARAAELVGSMS
jgi:hypothetical protein